MADWTAWLGPAADDMTADQRDRFERAAADATVRIGNDPDLAAEREIAWSAIAQYLLGEIGLDEAGAERVRTKIAERNASLVAQQVALLAIEDGVSEKAAAERAGLNRQTIRALQGKRAM